jgi:signal peptidase I
MNETPPEELTAVTKPRNAFIAFILSFLIPGLGQLYNGQRKKGIIFFALLLFPSAIFGLTRGVTFFYGLVALVIFEISWRIFTSVDAAKTAKRQKEYLPKSYNRWYFHLGYAIAALVILIVYDNDTRLGAKTFKIPSTGNCPTLIIDDRVVVDMKLYDHKNPGYGDLVAFQRENEQYFVYRVVGLPNDTISLHDDIVTVNGKECKSTFISEKPADEPVGIPGMQLTAKEFMEELPNGYKHRIIKLRPVPDSTRANFNNVVVPQNQYFLLGDNRDNAMDSRYIGPVNLSEIKGKIMYSYWGNSMDRININFRDK